MAKKRFVNINSSAFEKAHLQRIEKYASQVDYIYKWAADEFARTASTVKNYNPDKLFSFSDYPETRARVNKILQEAYSRIAGTIRKGTELEWLEAAAKNDKLVKAAFRSSRLSKEQLEKYNNRNLDALKSFQNRKTGGMGLSERVWKYMSQFKNEIELGLDIGLGEGFSAAKLSRVVRPYLQEPDKLFRRVRDKRGNLVLSKNALAYNPGTGVYRSSYKNAIRLTRTETNMAYRASDHERWKQMDFVVGIEIRLSNNPNHCPTCEALAGSYPKEFKFIGWHPQCRCHAISILKTDEEIDQDDLRILNGKKPLKTSVNAVTDVPSNFNDWLADNKERASRAKSTPYWILDNFKDGDINKGLSFKTKDVAPKKKDPVPAIAPPQFKPSAIEGYEKELGIKVDEDIFRLLNREVPLKHIPTGAYYDPSSQFVNIPFDERRRSSKWYAEAVVYHEYGHAADWQHGIRQMPEVKALMDKYRKIFAKNKNELYRSIDEKIWDGAIKSSGKGDKDMVNQYSAAHDTLMALNKNFGSGHTKAYFSSPGKPEAEFIAHMFENKFKGNDIFKQVMPELYEDMIKLADDIIAKVRQK